MALRDDYGGEGRIRQSRRTNWNRALRYFFGLILTISAGAIAFVLSEPVYTWLANSMLPEIPYYVEEMRILVGVGIFVILAMMFVVVFALLTPRRRGKDAVTESQLDKLKKEKLAEERARKMRQRKMRDRMRNRDRNV